MSDWCSTIMKSLDPLTFAQASYETFPLLFLCVCKTFLQSRVHPIHTSDYAFAVLGPLLPWLRPVSCEQISPM